MVCIAAAFLKTVVKSEHTTEYLSCALYWVWYHSTCYCVYSGSADTIAKTGVLQNLHARTTSSGKKKIALLTTASMQRSVLVYFLTIELWGACHLVYHLVDSKRNCQHGNQSSLLATNNQNFAQEAEIRCFRKYKPFVLHTCLSGCFMQVLGCHGPLKKRATGKAFKDSPIPAKFSQRARLTLETEKGGSDSWSGRLSKPQREVLLSVSNLTASQTIRNPWNSCSKSVTHEIENAPN